MKKSLLKGIHPFVTVFKKNQNWEKNMKIGWKDDFGVVVFILDIL